MEIRHPDPDHLEFSELGPFLTEMIRRVPDAAKPGEGSAAEQRLYPDAAADDDEFNTEWREFVEPDLRYLFQNALQTVRDDLAALKPVTESEDGAFTISRAHFEPWLSALNQARLCLAATHSLTEADLADSGPGTITSERDLALFQIHFYGLMQELLIRAIEETG